MTTTSQHQSKGALDPDQDYQKIAFRLSCLEFSWDIERSLEFALFRTYAVPSISGLLARTGEFEAAPRKRYDDTELLLCEPMENGLDSERGREAVKRINEIHGQFRISNADMLYVLSTFVLEPVRWTRRYGRRAFTPTEKLAWTNYYRALGERMGIQNIPKDLDAFEEYNKAYEEKHFRFADSNRRIGEVTLNLLLGFYLPKPLFFLGRPVALSLMDPPLLDAMGFKSPHAIVRRLVFYAMQTRARVLRILPRRRRPRRLTERARPTYPGGYTIWQLGPTRPLRRETGSGDARLR